MSDKYHLQPAAVDLHRTGRVSFEREASLEAYFAGLPDLPRDAAINGRGGASGGHLGAGDGGIHEPATKLCRALRHPLQLDETVTRMEPGWPQLEDFPLTQCLLTVVNGEWHHRLNAERDLDALVTTTREK